MLDRTGLYEKGRVALIRHGESQYNAQGIFTGWADPPLTELGRTQAVKAALWLEDLGFLPDIVISSDLQRAVTTAILVSKALAFSEADIETSEALRERCFGQLTGRRKTEAKLDTEEWAARLQTVEPKAAFSERVRVALEAVRARVERGSRVLIVSHSHVMREVAAVASEEFENTWPAPANGEGWILSSSMQMVRQMSSSSSPAASE